MRFEVCKSTKRGLGCFERLGKLVYENEKFLTTPSCTLYMPAGCIPYVTNDLLKHINYVPNIAEIPFASMYCKILFIF